MNTIKAGGMEVLDLTTITGVTALMESSRSEQEWWQNVDKVKEANNGGYPGFWFSKIVEVDYTHSELVDRYIHTSSGAYCRVQKDGAEYMAVWNVYSDWIMVLQFVNGKDGHDGLWVYERIYTPKAGRIPLLAAGYAVVE